MMNDFRNKRRPLLKKFWIHRNFQIKYSLFVVLITTFIMGVYSYLYYKNELSKTLLLGIQNSEVMAFLKSSDSRLILYLSSFIVLQFIIVFGLGIILTHRIAGPIHRLKDYFDYLTNGGQPRELGGIRENDEFKDFFASFVKFNKYLIEKERHQAQEKEDESVS